MRLLGVVLLLLLSVLVERAQCAVKCKACSGVLKAMEMRESSRAVGNEFDPPELPAKWWLKNESGLAGAPGGGRSGRSRKRSWSAQPVRVSV